MPEVGFTLERIAPTDAELLRKICGITRGLILCTGPSGSGKATTAAALLQEINRSRPERVFVIDTYPAYVFRGEMSVVTQLQVGRDIESVERGIQTAMHCDVDVLLLGDLPEEAIPAALTAADTGQLVIAVMEASSVRRAIERLLEAAGEQAYKVPGNLQVVLNQQLLPRIGGGRVAANEILIATPQIRETIREGRLGVLETLIDAGRPVGMKTMSTALAQLVEGGHISQEVAEARRRPS